MADRRVAGQNHSVLMFRFFWSEKIPAVKDQVKAVAEGAVVVKQIAIKIAGLEGNLAMLRKEATLALNKEYGVQVIALNT